MSDERWVWIKSWRVLGARTWTEGGPGGCGYVDRDSGGSARVPRALSRPSSMMPLWLSEIARGRPSEVAWLHIFCEHWNALRKLVLHKMAFVRKAQLTHFFVCAAVGLPIFWKLFWQNVFFFCEKSSVCVLSWVSRFDFPCLICSFEIRRLAFSFWMCHRRSHVSWLL